MTSLSQKEYAGLHTHEGKNGIHEKGVGVYKEEDEEADEADYLQESQVTEHKSESFHLEHSYPRWLMVIKPTRTIFYVTFSLLIAITLGWIIIPYFIRQQIANKVAISPEANPDLYSAWIHPPIPVYFKVYLFNTTNPEEVRKGAYPQLVELGPYVFQENRTKTDISHDDPTDTIFYKEHISFHFRQDLSGNARMDDVVTMINVPFAAAAIKIAHDLPWPLNDLAKTVVVSYKETLFIQRTVEEALFKGWKVGFLEKIEEDLGVNLLPNNMFGLFIGQNDTDLGPYIVSRGTHDKPSFGKILKFKNESHLNYWGDVTNFCNTIQGTDGTIFPPFITKSTTLRLFNPELCGSLSLTYNASAEFEGIKGYRFTIPQSVLEGPREGGENRCYCTTIDDEPEECLKKGAMDLGPCREGAPVAMSTPHFLDADPEYVEESGLVPEREKHQTYMDIEPVTGMILQISKKVQINLMLKRVKGLASLSKVPEMLFPLVWADECAALDPENAEKFKSILNQIWLLNFIPKWLVLFVALVVSLFLIFKTVKSTPKKIKNIKR